MAQFSWTRLSLNSTKAPLTRSEYCRPQPLTRTCVRDFGSLSDWSEKVSLLSTDRCFKKCLCISRNRLNSRKRSHRRFTTHPSQKRHPVPQSGEVEAHQRLHPLLTVNFLPHPWRDSDVRQHLTHGTAIRCRHVAVLLLRNVFRNLNGILAYGTKCVGQVFSAVNGHARSPRDAFPPAGNPSYTRRGRCLLRCAVLAPVARYFMLVAQIGVWVLIRVASFELDGEARGSQTNHRSKFVVVIRSKRRKSSTNGSTLPRCIRLKNIIESKIFRTRHNSNLFS